MSKPSIRWSKEKYRSALQGDGVPGLRTIIKGFEAVDGYDLRSFDSWTKSQRARVRKYYGEVHLLEAQPRRIVRFRDAGHLQRAQSHYHGDISSKNYKVAFVPSIEPVPLPGAKREKQKFRFSKEVDWVDSGRYSRGFVAFDKMNLMRNPAGEIDRCINALAGCELFYLQTGQFQTLNAKEIADLILQILKFMEQYDGKKSLPRSSGNIGDSPRAHEWKQWLNGIYGIAYPRSVDIVDAARRVDAGIRAQRAKRRKEDAKDHRKYGHHTVAELLRMIDNPQVKKTLKMAMRRELTLRGVKY